MCQKCLHSHSHTHLNQPTKYPTPLFSACGLMPPSHPRRLRHMAYPGEPRPTGHPEATQRHEPSPGGEGLPQTTPLLSVRGCKWGPTALSSMNNVFCTPVMPRSKTARDTPEGGSSTSASRPVHGPDWRYMDQIGEFWPKRFQEIIHRQRVRAPGAQGPPDWVAAPEGISYTCEDVTHPSSHDVTITMRTSKARAHPIAMRTSKARAHPIAMRTRLPIPEGCLNSDM